MLNNTPKLLAPVIILFVILNGFFIAGKSFLDKWNIDQSVLIIGNLILFAITLVSFYIGKKGLQTNNPQAFVRSVYSSFIIKFFVIVVAAFVYIMMAKKDVNKPALIICMLLYIVYTFFEVRTLMKLSKQKRNA